MKKYMGNKLAILLFVAPALAIFILFDFIPIVQVFGYSFTNWNGLTMPDFTGLKNYIKLFGDKVFVTSNRNQLIFAIIITVYQMFFATIFAITISDKKMKGRKFLRVAYFIPVILSVTVVCQLWGSILDGNGLLNKFFEVSGSDFKQNWLGDRYKAIYVISFVNAWQWMGYQFALIVAGIKSIPSDYYEAAVIDGCSNVKAHMKITIPLLAETYKFCLIISLTGGIKAFTEMNILTGGGPNKSTFTLTYMMYNAAFKKSDYGYGLAAASIMVLECMMVMLLINFIFRDKDQGKEEEKSRRKRNA
ncbi:carbohydrate ABC transporter permease [Butyrivibrio sp. WCD3002]|uniref:carbohydrate ABC transporter permease n=1 Tax=Butyrivibrio sp. WCD3002 TaxID=1280676 RepID=UPI00040CEE0D|nr:sugar ABC transporter permease [Butyrivibrio sp. WCD3002]